MKVTIWIVLIGLCGSALAADYYVATNGSDVAAGNIGAPFATIQYAADQMSAGDSCTIRGGRYPEEITVSNKDDLTFAAYSNETVVIDGSTVITNSWTQHAGNIYKTTPIPTDWISLRNMAWAAIQPMTMLPRFFQPLEKLRVEAQPPSKDWNMFIAVAPTGWRGD